MRVLPLRTGGDIMVASRMPNKYVGSAKKDGIVKKISKKAIILQYKDGTSDSIYLGDWTSKEEGGVTYLHTVITDMNVRDKVKKGDVVCYDKMFFARDMFDKKRVAMKTGTICNTMLTETEDTHEDAVAISENMTEVLHANFVKTISKVIPVTSDVLDMIKVGDKINYDDKLFTIVDNADENTDDVKGLSDDTIDILSDIKNKSPLSKVKGKVVDIRVVYNAEFETLSKSLQDVTTDSDARLKSRTGEDINGKVTSGYSINGKPLMGGFMEIKIYINTKSNMSLGSKMILGLQLKCVVSNTFPDSVSTVKGLPIDAEFSRRSISARNVNSPDIIGAATSVLLQLTKKAVDLYFD